MNISFLIRQRAAEVQSGDGNNIIDVIRAVATEEQLRLHTAMWEMFK
jgi:hypothetical protein